MSSLQIPRCMCIVGADEDLGVEVIKASSHIITKFYGVCSVPDNNDILQQIPSSIIISFRDSIDSVFEVTLRNLPFLSLTIIQTTTPDVVVICNKGWKEAHAISDKFKHQVPVITVFNTELYHKLQFKFYYHL